MATPMDKIKRRRAQAIQSLLSRGYLGTRVYVGTATCENAAGSEEVMEVFKRAVEEGELQNVYVSRKGCAGRCNLEPLVEVIEPEKTPVKYKKVDAAKARQIIERHLSNGEVIEEWVIR